MARRIRLDAARAAHHVMVRGLDGARIFLDAEDHQDFVDRLDRLLPDCDACCLAWALMPNHAHLVIQTERGELSRVMRRLNTGYAARFNRIYSRKGYVFQDRFRSRIVTGDEDLVGLLRYVHRNPLEARLVDSLDALARFPWCGHGALVGARRPFRFEAAAEALALFDAVDPRRASDALLAWMAKGASGDDALTSPAVDALETRSDSIVREWEAPGHIGVDAVLRAASERYGLTLGELHSGSKQSRISRARAVVAWISVVELGVPGKRVAQLLGVTPPAVSNALARGHRFSKRDGFDASTIFAPAGKKKISLTREDRPRASGGGSGR